MRKFIGFLSLMIGLFAFQIAEAQDVSINITNIPSIGLGSSTPILVTVCNEDPNPVDAPANKLRPQLSVSPNVTITGVTNTDGSPLTDFSVLSTSTGNGNTVILLLTVPLLNGECKSFNVNVTGTVVSGNTLFNATLGFQGPQTPGNITGNDNSPSGIAVTAAMPVTLVSFTAAREGKVAQLSWATTMETNSDRFEVEKSQNGKQWEMIGKVASNGESSVKRQYSFTDKNPFEGENLYRLKMVDKDATFAYSRIQSVKFDGGVADLSVYPNPATDQLFIRDYGQVTRVVINDLNGRAVYQSGGTATISVRNLPAGMYVATISRSNGLVSSQKIIISR
jgi:hypothetical protein